MAQEDLLIVLGHAWQCSPCQAKLLQHNPRSLAGQRLSKPEHELLDKLTEKQFSTLNALAEATGTTTGQLYDIMNHPRCRLRHF